MKLNDIEYYKNNLEEYKGYEMPKEWSTIAKDIFISKYIAKNHERSVMDTLHRLCSTWCKYGVQYKYFDSNEEANIFYNHAFELLFHQVISPNSPQWFNTGLYDQYGIESDKGYVYNEHTGEIEEHVDRPFSHACFILSVDDNLVEENGIYDLLKKEATIFKQGSGSGTNYSNIRSKGYPISKGGVSSGVISFLDTFNKSAGSIKSGGTSRRSAKMSILNIDHLDIEDFINWKSKEENKIAYLVAGYNICNKIVKSLYDKVLNCAPEKEINKLRNTALSYHIPFGYVDKAIKLAKENLPFEMEEMKADFTNASYETISGQNTNNSIRVGDDFMFCVKNKIKHTTKYGREMDAHDIFMKICKSAWECGDPGLQFHDIINDNNTCKNTMEINASNPCGEFNWVDNSACNLGSLNLLKFYDSDSDIFDYDYFEMAIRTLVYILDISVSMAQYPTKEIAENSVKYRPIGLGYTNLGAVLMAKCLPYGNYKPTTDFVSHITSYMTNTAYRESNLLAKKLGSFYYYKDNKEVMNTIVGIESDDIEKYGFRNSQATLLAATGTIGLVMDCETFGIEPYYAITTVKKTIEGDYITILNKSFKTALSKLGYTKSQILEIEKNTNNEVDFLLSINLEHHHIFRTAIGENSLSYIDHLEVMKSAQKHLSGAISKTINLPSNCSVKDVYNCFMYAWENGLKSITIYRDGSKLSQPNNESIDKNNYKIYERGEKELLSKRRHGGFTQKVNIDGHDLYVRTGEYDDGRVGEIFIDMYKEGAAFRSILNSFARSISIGLQHGVPIEKYIRSFVDTKFDPCGIISGDNSIKFCKSIIDYIFRLLSNEYTENKHTVPKPVVPKVDIEENITTGNICLVCGSNKVVKTGSCSVCKECGSSSGCS